MINLLTKIFIKDRENTSDPQVRAAYGVLTGVTGIILNILLFASKLIAGLMLGVISITADAFNNLSDAGSSIITMLGLKMANKPVDKEHPFGHGRMEYISGLIVAIIIILVGLELIKTSVEKLLSGEEASILQGKAYIASCIILIAAIFVKLWMFLYNRKISIKINSLAMRATAIDSISDAVATTVVLACSILSRYVSNVPIDAIAGLGVSVFILYSGAKSIKEIVDELIGKAPDAELVRQIYDLVTADPIVENIHDLVIHDYGAGRMMITLHAEVSADNDILVAHDSIDNIEQLLSKTFNCHATIHMDPIIVNDENVVAMKQVVEEAVKSVNQEFTMHDFRMNKGNTHTNLIFDVVVTHTSGMKEEEIRAAITEKIQLDHPECNTVITVDYSYV